MFEPTPAAVTARGGPTEMKKAIEFTKRWFDIGADDVEHADHDGSASPDRVYAYYSMLLDTFQKPDKHIVHFHTTRGWGLANVLAALQAGMTNFESTMGGIGGQPANFVDGVPVAGTGSYYYADPMITGLVQTEDMVVMMDERGIDTGLDTCTRGRCPGRCRCRLEKFDGAASCWSGRRESNPRH